MRINSVTMPIIEGQPTDKAIKMLYDHCKETAGQIMRMSNEIEDLKSKIHQLEMK